MNSKEELQLREALKGTRSPYEIQNTLDLKLSQIKEAMVQMDLQYLPGWGRVSMQHHLVGRKLTYGGWPSSIQDLMPELHRLHDSGKIILCQGRDINYILQYAVLVSGSPLRRAAYFTGG